MRVGGRDEGRRVARRPPATSSTSSSRKRRDVGGRSLGRRRDAPASEDDLDVGLLGGGGARGALRRRARGSAHSARGGVRRVARRCVGASAGNDRASVVTARAGRNETFEYARIRRRRFCRRAFQRIGRLSNAPKYRSTNRRATGTSRFQKDDPADQNGRRSRGRRSAIATTTDHDGRFWAIEATRARGRLGRDTRRVAAHRALAPPRVFSPRVFAPTRRASDATSRAGRVVAAS